MQWETRSDGIQEVTQERDNWRPGQAARVLNKTGNMPTASRTLGRKSHYTLTPQLEKWYSLLILYLT